MWRQDMRLVVFFGIVCVISGSSSNSGISADRICKIETLEGASVVGAQSHHETQWTELLLRLRRWIMEAFEFKCFQYEEEVRVLDTKRSFRGWDFAPFFVAKERLALIYQQMYLLDDAIRHLDELEAIFLSLIQSENRFEENSQTFVYDAQHPIFTTSPLALDMAEMHHQIARHQAPALLMRLYFFSRQIRTLYLMGDFKQLTERAMGFIPSFHDLLLSSLGGIAKNVTMALHQWAVGACLEIAYACELSWSGHDYQILG
ncbi:hypothetical protein Poli38472_014939 [Pythium oligandrum]|uniref:TRAPPC10/Trs130 N-terminal domain-containing protein n=1 Tax=Pythium oligandrum TaxID=41045 RepID=A0A8K1C7E6_PYTOL|nr:hypothetical protein Poli38472_014939 [Pythium oligandrum]|eukprot:TMW57680.1 hypothetical protein Poli38472_014939 [Pythium oligandrum]